MLSVRENVLLGPLTTLGVGGPARYLVEATSIEEVKDGLEFARSRKLALFVLGGGSNLVVSDSGWPGVVLKVAIGGIERTNQGEAALYRVGAGESWDRFVSRAVGENCAGVECLSGIPGSVGGTPVQNVGAYGQEVSETVAEVLAVSVADGSLEQLSGPDCRFSYRASIFNTTEKQRHVIVGVAYRLTSNGQPRLEYGELKKHFVGWNEPPTLADAREAVRRIRASKGMLITAGDEDCRSAGSFFKNPVLSPAQYAELSSRAALKRLEVPSYPALEAHRKVSAAWLVEHSGYGKGFSRGGVGISRKHALAIVNRGQARAEEIVELQASIQDRVQHIWGISLEPEPVMVGF